MDKEVRLHCMFHFSSLKNLLHCNEGSSGSSEVKSIQTQAFYRHCMSTHPQQDLIPPFWNLLPFPFLIELYFCILISWRWLYLVTLLLSIWNGKLKQTYMISTRMDNASVIFLSIRTIYLLVEEKTVMWSLIMLQYPVMYVLSFIFLQRT